MGVVKKDAGGFNDADNRFLNCEVGCVDGQMRAFLIPWRPEFKKVLQGFFRIRRMEQGPVRISRNPVEKNVNIGVDPDDVTKLAEKLAVFGPYDDAAARGDDLGGIPGGEVAEEFGFKVAEMIFPACGENIADGCSGPGFDHCVGINQGQTQIAAYFPADGGFAGAHDPDEDDARRRLSRIGRLACHEVII